MGGLETPTLPEAEPEPTPEAELDLETIKRMVRVSHGAIESLFKKLNLLQRDESLPPFLEAQIILNDKKIGPMATHHSTTGELELRKNLTTENAIISVLHELVHYYAVNAIAFARTKDHEGTTESRGRIKTGFHVHNKRTDSIGHEHLRSFNEGVVQTTTIELLNMMAETLNEEFPELSHAKVVTTAENIYTRDRAILDTVVNKITAYEAEKAEEPTHVSEQAVRYEIMAAQFTGNTLPTIRKIEQVCGKGALRVIGAGRAIQKVGEDQKVNNAQLDTIKAFLEAESQIEKDDLAGEILGPFEYYQYVLHVHIRDIRQELTKTGGTDWSMAKKVAALDHLDRAVKIGRDAFGERLLQEAESLMKDTDQAASALHELLESAGYSPNQKLETIAQPKHPPATAVEQRRFLVNLLLNEQLKGLLDTRREVSRLLHQ